MFGDTSVFRSAKRRSDPDDDSDDNFHRNSRGGGLANRGVSRTPSPVVYVSFLPGSYYRKW
jgi:hypothetical protein